MRQVFRNLLQNAVSIAPDPVRVDVGFAPEQAERPHVRVRVVDNGPGVSPEALERVFEPFWTQRPGGSGLGLALARRLARAHGGELWARPGPGGVFELRLPCVQAVAATADGGPEGGESSPPSGSEGVATAS
jgi:signal transduction histidine kinase